jgi:hypothetical protein
MLGGGPPSMLGGADWPMRMACALHTGEQAYTYKHGCDRFHSRQAALFRLR